MEVGQSREALPSGLLLALAPALRSLVGTPGAAVLVVPAHLHAMLGAPALRVCWALRGWLRWRLHLEPFGRLLDLRLVCTIRTALSAG